jgi:N-acetylmuramoyl-L-alanine amidase
MMNNKRFNILIHTFVFTLFFISLDIIACNGNLCHSACAIDLFKPHTKGNGIKTVVIDAGHGGKDPGCIGVLHKEKDVTLAVALHLGKLIEENLKDVKVIYTRKKDIFVELEERAQIANRNNADLFISIHCNAAATTVTYKDKKGKIRKKEVHNPKPYGSETYVMGIKNEKGNMEVAKRENAAMLLEENYKTTYNGFDPNSDEAYIIMSIYTGAFVEQSAIFASKIQNEYVRKAGRVDKGVHRQSIWVLWRTAMPSILTEVGFLTNPEEEKFLGSDKGQKYLASAIFRALRSYKNDVEGVKINYDDEIENETPLENENKGIVYPTIPSFIDSSSIGNSEENSKKVKEMISAGDQLLKEGKFEDALKQYKSAKAIKKQ